MNKPYVVMIDEELALLQQRIEELLITKRVIAQYSAGSKGTGASDMGASGHAAPQMLKLTDTSPKKSHHKKTDRVRGPHVQTEFIEHIKRLLAASPEPLRSSVIIEMLEAEGVKVERKQRVWAALSVMKERGMLRHFPHDRSYTLKLESPVEKTDEVSTQAG